MKTLPDATALLAFDALARCVSFTAAADDQGCAKSRISQLVKQLEQDLGAVLVLRNTRRVALTEAGEKLARHASELRGVLERVRPDIASMQDEVAGPLVISAGVSFGQFLLAPLLAELATHYPELRLQLQLENRLQDPVAEGLDFCIRTRSVRDERLVAKPLGFAHECFYAAPAYLAKAPPLLQPEDLPQHRLLLDSHPNERPNQGWLLEKQGEQRQIHAHPVLSSRMYTPRLSAALAGNGVALLPPYVADPHLQSGQLVETLPGWTHDSWPVFLVYPYRQPLPRKYQAVIEYLLPRLRAALDPDQGGRNPARAA